MVQSEKRKGTFEGPKSPCKVWWHLVRLGPLYDHRFPMVSGAIERGHGYGYICLDNEKLCKHGVGPKKL